ncbi:hypothetical protein JCM5296_004141 [Sporobolomyces johnsonii]
MSITPPFSDFRPIYVPSYPPPAHQRTSFPPSTLEASSLAALSTEYGKDKEGVTLVQFGLPTPQHNPTQLRRQLKARHIAMISIGGVIGTGLFLGTAQSLQKAGPLGLLLAYMIVGSMVWCMMISLGEMVSHLPLGGGHITLASRTVDSAFGMAVGWTYCANWLLVFPAELSAAAVLISMWSDANPAAWIAICYVCVLAVNLAGTRAWAEVEGAVVTLKVITILGLIILGIVISAGGVPGTDSTGFTYWRSPGAFAQYLGIPGALGRFAGFWSVLTQAAYAYVGSEIVSLAAGEASNPSRSLPRSIHAIVLRIALFYIVGVFVIGLVVPSNDPALGKQDGTALSSPFVIAIERAGIKALPSIANAAFLTSATSAASSGLYTASRCLYGLAINGNAPQIFTRLNSYGLPYVSVCACSLFGLLSFMSAGSHNASIVFTWLSNCCAVGGLMSWACICAIYLRFYYGAKAQDIPRSVFPFKSSFQPYAAYYALIGLCIILFTQGFDVFIHDNWNTAEFVTKYLMIVLFPIIYFATRLYQRCELIPLPAIDFFSGSRDNDESEELPPKGALQRLWYALA